MLKELIAMFWKSMVISICLLSSIGVSFGLINLNPINDGGTQICQCPSENEVSGRNVIRPLNNLSSINIANNNGANGHINQNIGNYSMAALNQSTQSCIMPSLRPEYVGFEYTGNGQIADRPVQYTIIFLNINYENYPGRDQVKAGKTSVIQQYPLSFKDTLKQLAENSKVLEKERNENIRLLKEIAS